MWTGGAGVSIRRYLYLLTYTWMYVIIDVHVYVHIVISKYNTHIYENEPCIIWVSFFKSCLLIHIFVNIIAYVYIYSCTSSLGEHPFKAFAPGLFQELRNNEGIDDEKYLKILSSTANERLSEGTIYAYIFVCVYVSIYICLYLWTFIYSFMYS
jgi:hypothetical protein